MDHSSLLLARDNHPIHVFDFEVTGAMKRIDRHVDSRWPDHLCHITDDTTGICVGGVVYLIPKNALAPIRKTSSSFQSNVL
ncbi:MULTISPECIES: hypothetical protein [unclassified Exiguobacterium]|uniref:hypothetical protein n=1 Tax=unclassified Exiguobacterium TaxID=2644629 RepID=UPI001BE994BD|nr:MULTISPECIES: hypothetical protein [unclassified Exiguobacterium]